MKATKTVYLVFLLMLGTSVYGEQINRAKALWVAEKFLKSTDEFTRLKAAQSMTLSLNEGALESLIGKDAQGNSTLFIVDINKGCGFVIIAGDDRVRPVLAYSLEGNFNSANIPPAFASWLQGYIELINFVQNNNVNESPDITSLWAGNFDVNPSIPGINSVSPLVKTKWNQSAPYNAECPMIGNSRAATGCVATAMAQVMKYWNYPETGQGNHSYFDEGSGTTLSADFGSTTYNWSEMPNEPLSFGTYKSLAVLMSHCGISVDMTYGIQSSASVIGASPSAEFALETYFGYSPQLFGALKDDYTEEEWISLLKSELIAGRPILYAGCNPISISGHAFICDGFNTQSYFHFNWGWGGSGNGNFLIISNLDAGNNHNYSLYQHAILGIQPPADRINYDIRLYRSMIVTPNPVNYGSQFTVTTNFSNYGSTSFNGEFCAAIFEPDGTFVDYVDIISATLPSGHHYTEDIQITSSQSFSLLPGSYDIWVYYKPSGGNWKIVKDGSYNNYSSLTVKWSSNIELYKEITVSPHPLTQGESATFSFDIVNRGTSTFNGTVSVVFYDLDGTNGHTIQTSGSLPALPVDYHIVNGLTLQTSNLNVEPGTYLCAIIHTTSSGTSKLTGATNYQNPIKVTVLPAPLYADSYEPNNSVAASRLLPVSFTGNQAEKNTQGSNIHQASDIDYYKLILPVGYNYTVRGRLLHESYNPTSDKYTLKGQVYFSTDGVTWTNRSAGTFAYPQTIQGGTIFYIVVSPKETGFKGTYRLDLVISRSAGLSDDTGLSDLKVDGKTIPGFDPDNRIYRYVLPYGTTTIPSVTATTRHPRATKEIIAATGLPGLTTVRVTAENGTSKLDYDIYFSVSTDFVDLLISNVSFTPQTIVPGGTVLASATVANLGNLPASGVKTTFYFSLDNVFDSNDWWLQQSPSIELPANSNQFTTALLTLSNETQPGSYFLISYVDKGNTIIESNETNNIFISPLNVTSNTGITETPIKSSFSIYPNPAKDIVNVDLSNFNGTVDRIELLNLLGQVVYSKVSNQVSDIVQISTAGFKSGVYVMLISSRERRFNKTVIIE